MLGRSSNREVRKDLVFVASCELLRDRGMEESELIKQLPEIDKYLSTYDERDLREALFYLTKHNFLIFDGQRYRLNQ